MGGKKEMFSLIVTTRNTRSEEFKRFINSLSAQSYESFELIVINQGNSDLISDILSECSFDVKEIPEELISLSKARNIGLQYACGKYIAFPDDDCWYDEDLLRQVYIMFKKWNADCISCNVYDPFLGRALSAYKRRRKFVRINELNASRYTISVGIFCKNNSDKFDEELGVGAKWGAGEETDYIYRLLNDGYKIIYCRDIKVYHQFNTDSETDNTIDKSYKYGLGYGALVRKLIRRKQYGVVPEYVYTIIRTVAGIFIYGIKNKRDRSAYYLQRLKGMIKGVTEA